MPGEKVGASDGAFKDKKKKLPRSTLLVDPRFIAEAVVHDGKAQFLRFDRKDGTLTAAGSLDSKGKTFIPLEQDDSLIGFVRFPSGVEEYGSDAELFEDVRRFIRKWSDLEEKYEKLAALYVLFTWIYDEFFEIPFLRVIGDLGSGKSRLGVSVLGSVCYKSFSTIAASTLSPIFRTLDFLGGTFVLDEADMGEKSDKTSELVQVLNSGYMKGLSVMRSEIEGRNGFKVAKYKVFGPKIIVSREHFKDAALESRCLEIKVKQTTRKDIPFLIDESLEEQAMQIRNKLLLWRFRGWGTRRAKIDPSFAELDVPPRLKQLLLLMSGVTQDPAIIDLLKSLGTEATAEHAERRADTFEGEIVGFLAKMGPGVFVSCKTIADSLNASLAPKDQKTAKSIGWYMRERLGLVTEKGAYPDYQRGLRIDRDTLTQLCKRYGVDTVFGVSSGGELVQPLPIDFDPDLSG